MGWQKFCCPQPLSFVQGREVRFRHVHFAADFEHVRRIRDALRNVGDCADVRGHVLAHRTVAARRGKHQLSQFIAKRAAQSVDLGLRGHRHRRVRRQRKEALHPRHELRDLVGGKGILQAEHRPCMGNLGERAGRCRAEPLRRRIRSHQLREALLEVAVFANERVIFRVGNLRRILVMIELVVPSNLPRQPHQAVGGVGFAYLSLSRLAIRARRTIPRAGR